MSTIFISHSSHDNEAARELTQWLESKGHVSLFLDLDPEKGIVAGKSWEQTLYRKLRACRVVVAICTDHYLKSHWCFAEIALGRMEGKHLFALLSNPLSDGATLPAILTEKQFIDLRKDHTEGLQRLWRGLNEIDVLGTSTDWDPRQAPYLGLSAYQEKHAPIFFGRETETQQGIELLERGAPGLVLTLGSSGTGKSSLVRAGIVPRLRRDTERWIIIDPMRPAADPFFELANALFSTWRQYAPAQLKRIGEVANIYEQLSASVKPSALTGIEAEPSAKVNLAETDGRVAQLMEQLESLQQKPPEEARGRFMNFLEWSLEDLRQISQSRPARSNPGGSTQLLEMLFELQRHSASNARILLVIDQFEELLDQSDLNAPQNRFMRLLRDSIEAPHSPLITLGTMRTDYLTTFQQTPAMHDIDFESLSIGPVGSENLRRIIEAPAQLAAIKLQDGLTDLLIKDTSTADALPLLSFTLWVLWRDYREDGEIDIAEYRQLGGLHGAITKEADALLTDANEAQLRSAFLQMARINEEGNYARKPIPWDTPELQPIHALLQNFVDRRLLFIHGDDDVRQVEVTHEAIFRSWRPLKQWLDENRAELMLKREVSQDVKSWFANNKPSDNLWRGARLQQASRLLGAGKLDEKESEFIQRSVRRERRNRRIIVATTMAVLVGMAALTANALKSQRNAIKAQQQAQKAQQQTFANYYGLLNSLPVDNQQRIIVNEQSVPGVILGTNDPFKPLHGTEDNDWMIAGNYELGKIFAVAHDDVLTETTSSNAIERNRLLLNVIRWMAPTEENIRKTLLYSTGHCEVVTGPSNGYATIPIDFIEENTHFELMPIKDLTTLPARGGVAGVIIGNAWGKFSTSEIEATKEYVEKGGNLIMAGLHWSWNIYKVGDGFNPCTFDPDSNGKEREINTYPMNQLASSFGISWGQR